MSTHHVRLGQAVLAISSAQRRVLARVIATKTRSAYVYRGEVRSARMLASLGFGVLHDDGAGPDNLRWLFVLCNLPMGDAL